MTEKENLGKSLTSFENGENFSMGELIKDYDKASGNYLGKELEVTIIEENADGFMVDLGMKFEGIIPKNEFEEGEIPLELNVGAKVRAKVVNMRGQAVLSYKEVMEQAKLDTLQESFEKGSRIRGVISENTKGGLVVDIGGINAFLHISQLSTHFVKETEKYIGKSYEFVIIKFDRKRKNIVVSRRKILEEEKNSARLSALESITEGQIIDGIVSNITSFGAFVNLGGINGLLHIGDIVWYKIKKVEDLLHLGQTVRVRVLKVDKLNGKISLSMKSLTPNPWEYVSERLPAGLIIKGIVTSVTDYGAFIEVDPGVEGLLRVDEYAWSDAKTAFRRDVKKAQEIEVKVINVDEVNRKIFLSVKRMHTNPWDEVFKHYAPGTVVKGIVQNFMPFGAFIKLPEGIEGLVHINDFSWTTKVRHPEDFLERGDEVEVVVLEVNPKNEKISLSLKHINPDPYEKYKVGGDIKGKIVRTMEFGVFVELERGVEALIKNNEIFAVRSDKEQFTLKEGVEVSAKVIRVDMRDRKIEASIRKFEFDKEKELIKKYANQDEKPTLGEILEEE